MLGLLFTACVVVFLYILAGYPLLLSRLARWRAKPVRKAPYFPTVTIIVSVYNGAPYLGAKLDSIAHLDYPPNRLNVIVVSDGSTDATEEVARKFPGVDLLVLPRGGKPAALNAAIPHATGEIIVLTDVRQTLAPESIRVLMECFADVQVGVVSGEVIVKSGDTNEAADIGLYWRLESRIRDWLGSLDSIFGATGQFYAMRRALAIPVPVDMLNDDMYLPLSAFFKGYRLIVESRALAYDVPMSLATEFRRKVRTLAGNYQVLLAYPGLLGPQNRLWFHYVSYKFGRLLLPWLMVLIAGLSFALPVPWNFIALAGQALFYGLAACDPVIGASSPLKKISSPARTFVVMMFAIVKGLSIFFVPARSLWTVTSTTKDL